MPSGISYPGGAQPASTVNVEHTPSNYTVSGDPATTTVEDHLTAIDQALQNIQNSLQSDGDTDANFTWHYTQDASVVMQPDHAYVSQGGSQLIAQLPAIAEQGTRLQLLADNSAGWRIAQGSGQSISTGEGATITGETGYMESLSAGDRVRLLCIEANTRWRITYIKGDIFFNQA